MFDKINQIKKIKEIQGALKNERIEVEKKGIKLTINGNLEVEELILDPSLEKQEQEKLLISCFNDAIRKIQMIAAQKMSQMGGF